MTNFLFDKNAAINCCKGCTTETGRHIGCHSTCEKYQEQAKKRQENKKEAERIVRRNEVIKSMQSQRNKRILAYNGKKPAVNPKKFS